MSCRELGESFGVRLYYSLIISFVHIDDLVLVKLLYSYLPGILSHSLAQVVVSEKLFALSAMASTSPL